MTDKTLVELLPCPFCDAQAVFDKPKRGWGIWVRCTGCQAEMFGINEDAVADEYLQEKVAADNWNKRSRQAFIDETVGAIRADVNVFPINNEMAIYLDDAEDAIRNMK